jgi:hypothetical protein
MDMSEYIIFISSLIPVGRQLPPSYFMWLAYQRVCPHDLVSKVLKHARFKFTYAQLLFLDCNNEMSHCITSINITDILFSNFTGTANSHKTPQEYFQQYISRDIIILVGRDDTSAGGDQYCPALMQGGTARRDRNLAWWSYINTLARTGDPVEMFRKANFSGLPDWSIDSPFMPRLVVVDDAKHDAEEVFGSDEGRAALFSNGDVPLGWRPDGYQSRKTDCTYCDDNNRNGGRAGDDDDNSAGHLSMLGWPVGILLSLAPAAVLFAL